MPLFIWFSPFPPIKQIRYKRQILLCGERQVVIRESRGAGLDCAQDRARSLFSRRAGFSRVRPPDPGSLLTSVACVSQVWQGYLISPWHTFFILFFQIFRRDGPARQKLFLRALTRCNSWGRGVEVGAQGRATPGSRMKLSSCLSSTEQKRVSKGPMPGSRFF